MKKAGGMIVLVAFIGVCLLSTLGFDVACRAVARADGWLPATSTSISWSPQGEPATFIAQDGVVYKIMLPAGKYSSYVGSSKQHEIIYNVRNPPSFFLPNEEKIFAFIFFLLLLRLAWRPHLWPLSADLVDLIVSIVGEACLRPLHRSFRSRQYGPRGQF